MSQRLRGGTGGARRAPPYHSARWAACSVCLKVKLWRRRKRGDRLRDHVSDCCSARLHVLSWSGWSRHERDILYAKRRSLEQADHLEREMGASGRWIAREIRDALS